MIEHPCPAYGTLYCKKRLLSYKIERLEETLREEIEKVRKDFLSAIGLKVWP
jgi:hypothetical protein